MKASDIVLLAINNLRRNTLRTILTILGVAVGVGSLAAMISFGQGISGNVSKSMESNDIFTGLTVTARDIDFQGFGNKASAMQEDMRTIVPLNDSAISAIRQWPEVAVAFPEVIKPAVVRLKGHSIKTNLKAVPSEMGKYSPFNAIKRGQFFTEDDDLSLVISKNLLAQMSISIEGSSSDFESSPSMQKLPLDSILGQNLEIVTKVFDPDKIESLFSNPGQGMPLKDEVTLLKIGGIVENNSFTAGMFTGGVFVPSQTIHYIPAVDFQDIYDIMEGTSGKYGTYNTAHIRVNEHTQLKPTKVRLEQMGFMVFSIGDKLDDIENIFLVLDSILAAIGVVALFVSVLGIVNTLIMAIYERRKEIGIMKSLGATQAQIKMIFHTEAAIIGLLGGIIGVAAGMMASKLASSVANSQIGKLIDCDIEYFEFSWMLVAGAIVFSVIISILASIYPASRASKIDPLDALRRD